MIIFIGSIMEKPMYGLEKDGWFFLNIEKVMEVTPYILKDIKKLGVECIEIGGPLWRVEKMEEVLKNRRDIEIILHTEGDPPPDKMNSYNFHTRIASIENVKRNIDFAERIDSSKIVLHPPPFCEFAVDIIKEIVGYGKEKGVNICIENCKYGIEGIEELMKYGERIEDLLFTFDTGHCNIGFSPAEGVKMLGSRISHIHLHDNNGKKDQHLPPGKGNIDFDNFFTELWKIDRKKLTVTLECDKPGVNYEEVFEELKALFLKRWK
ncbi:sugar phosphate isomerase/epimerase [bacterium]|nr:sugar phosphate isomerase/epimerase [bacterium]